MKKVAARTAESYKRIFFLTDEDVQTVRQVGQQVDDGKMGAFAELYAWIELQENLSDVFTDDILDEFERQEDVLWGDLMMGVVDDASVARLMDLGHFIYQNGIPFDAYLAALVSFHHIIENIFVRRGVHSFELLRSFKKLTGIHISIANDVYNDIINKTIIEQNDALSAPVTKLWDGILFLPLVGIVDSRRAQDVMTAMLDKIAETQSKVFVLDISGIAVMDTAVANYLIKITKAARLMGCSCILAGISSSVAQTIVELGIQTNELMTTGGMQDAIVKAFSLYGAKIVENQEIV